MNLEQAKRLLDIAPTDNQDDIKRKYRRMMGFFHPDVLGSDHPAHIRRAQEINEAYELLKDCDFLISSSKQAEIWKGVWNENAFWTRNIYLYYAMEGAEGHPYYQAARGNYMWEPEEEDFELFLTSIHHATEELLEQCESKVYSKFWEAGEAVREKRFQYQAMLFQCLATQYMDPVKTLQELAGRKRKDKQGREIYCFRAFLGGMKNCKTAQRFLKLKVKDHLYPEVFLGSKIAVKDREGYFLGHLSLEEDWAYFCMVPLLKARLAQIKMTVKGMKTLRDMRGTGIKVEVDLWLRLEAGVSQYETQSLNRRMEELLAGYEKVLRSC